MTFCTGPRIRDGLLGIAIYKKVSNEIAEYGFARNDLKELSTRWQKFVSQAVEELPAECIEKVFQDLPREYTE